MSENDGGERIIRPALPLLLFPLAALWVGQYGAERLKWASVSPSFLVFLCIGALLILIALSILKRRAVIKTILPSILCIAVVGGFASGMVFWTSAEDKAQRIEAELSENPQTICTLVIREDPKKGSISQTSLADLSIDGQGSVGVRILWQSDQEPSPMGMRLHAQVRLKPLTDKQEFLYRKGVLCSVTIDAATEGGFGPAPLAWIYDFREHNRKLLAATDREGSALLRGVILGDTTALDESQAGGAFKATGLSHLVAVSGSHLVVIAILVSWFIGKLGLRRSIEFALIAGLLIAYVLLTGLQPSAIRSCIMALTASLSPFVGRRAHIPSALSVAAVAMLALHPPTAFSVGFWLSVFAVFGLTLFCPLVIGFLQAAIPSAKGGRGFGPKLRQGMETLVIGPLGLTATAQLATLPITAPLFATIPLISPIANLVVTPFITVLVGGGIVLVCIMPLLGPLGPILLLVLCSLAECAGALALFFSRLHLAALPVSLELLPCIALGLLIATLLYRIWPKPSPKLSLGFLASLACVGLTVFVIGLLPAQPSVVALDIGQGDAILVREGSSVVLVDTGKSGSLLLKALARQKVNHLDAVVITHLDDDHCGALEALSGVVTVDHVFFAEGVRAVDSGKDVLATARSLLGGREPETLSLGDTLDLGETLVLTMLWPQVPIVKGGNEESIGLALEYDRDKDAIPEARMLLTGDLEAPELEALFATTDDPRFDVLKVGHHGSRDAVTLQQLETMDCRFALISAGIDNHYGHPTPETLGILEEAGVRVFRTDLNGDISLRFSGERLTFRCANILTELSSS